MEKNSNNQIDSTRHPLPSLTEGAGGGSLFNIKDYVVVITGGTGVLGRAIAKYLALEGAKVVILGRKCHLPGRYQRQWPRRHQLCDRE